MSPRFRLQHLDKATTASGSLAPSCLRNRPLHCGCMPLGICEPECRRSELRSPDQVAQLERCHERGRGRPAAG